MWICCVNEWWMVRMGNGWEACDLDIGSSKCGAEKKDQRCISAALQ